MNLADIASFRLINQQIIGTGIESPKELVRWMGAMQAQDYPMAKWAVGIRLPHSTENSIERAIDNGEIVRTHVLRPTWHFVSADDLHWMLEVSAPRIKASMRSRDKELELTESLFERSNRVIRKALAPDKHLTRENLRAALTNAGIPTDKNRASHLFLRAELDGIICSGRTKGKTHTYALLEHRVPPRERLSREESLTKLARTYFSSHGPATLRDFTWWSGLSTKDATCALEMIRSEFVSAMIGANTYWFPDSFSLRIPKKTSTFLLPAFDEFIISYKDRTATVDLKHQATAVSDNGIFRPAIVINGRLSGLWKRTLTNGRVVVKTKSFRPHTRQEKQLIQKAGDRFGEFVGRAIEMIYGAY